MKLPLRLLLVAIVVVFSGQAFAARVVRVPPQRPASVPVEGQIDEPAEVQKLQDQRKAEKREQFLKELRELYKQDRQEN